MNNIFMIVKQPLWDKEDEYEVGYDNVSWHTYYLYFNPQRRYKVKKSVYMEAVIGAEYYIVLTPDQKIVAVYQASNWTLGEDIMPYMVIHHGVEQ